jgi:murein DD-endopeptidase MepM/ murein hydrolase activator NlpD
VDEKIVAQALKRAAELVGSIEPAPLDEESRVELSHSGVARFVWPISPVQITSRFGVRVDPFGDGPRRHLGLDLAAIEGQSVISTADGVVRYAGMRGGYGLHVEIHHDDGYISRYAHLSKVFVASGSRVIRGDSIGRAGRTGRATGPHLHFEVWRKGVPLDPMHLINDMSPLAWAE